MPVAISGDVIEAHSQWVADRIVTEATIHTPDGDVVVSQLGGSAGGLTMRQFPAPPVLELGMAVDVTAHDAMDLSGGHHLAVDQVVVHAQAGPRFVRTGPTKAGHFLFWKSGCIFVSLDSDGTKAAPFADIARVVTASIATWNTSDASCSYMQIVENAPVKSEVGNDGVNLIKFRDDSWCRPAVDKDPARCYDDAAAGITTAVFIDDAKSTEDGEILDADIEINNTLAGFAVSIDGQSTNPNTCHAELQNTLTHELGHLHGLEHTCRVPSDPDRVDGNGGVVPLCTDTTDPVIVEATMFPFQDCGETKKETLADDDISGICTIYPTASDPGTCAPAALGSGGCCDAGGSPGAALVLVASTSLLLVRRRRDISKP